ncbi:MAG: type II secretion system protein GspM [Thiolinea sp.]
MSDRLLSRRNQPLLAWLLLLLVVLMAVFWGVLPALAKSMSLSEQIDDGYRRLSKMQQIRQATPEFMAEYERVRDQGLDQLFYPEGMTAAQVGKELQKQLTTVVGQHQGELLSSEVVEDVTDEEDQALQNGFQRVTVQADFQGDSRLLREVLHQPYRTRPLIFIDRLEIKPERDSQEQLLRVTVRVSTYWRGGASNETMD